jgi:hypothetical protein
MIEDQILFKGVFEVHILKLQTNTKMTHVMCNP